MFLSVFEIFKIGIGPSSSHTMGPMTAAARFLDQLRQSDNIAAMADGSVRLHCSLHGSLAFTGKGHATDRAVILGLSGSTPETLDADEAATLEASARERKAVHPPGFPALAFDPDVDLVFDYGPPLAGHANGLKLWAEDASEEVLIAETYFSIGGGFVLTENELEAAEQEDAEAALKSGQAGVPYPFASAAEMLAMGDKHGKSIAEMKRANELETMSPQALSDQIDTVLAAMDQCVERGLRIDGVLPGGLNVKRRAMAIKAQLDAEQGRNFVQPHAVNDWLAVYAMAVNEENAAGGRVVTAPTNGAAGVIPAVIRYYRDHCVGTAPEKLHTFLLTAAAIGGLIKHNASISGAEVGCQGEVGSACAMAAAGLCAALDGTNAQIENAAEIALEHHLGMTCDPASGLVQVPCIERNGMGAIKAVSAASLALRGDGSHFMPLDNCIEAMRQTGLDMMETYKETSQGGLAVNLPEC